MKQLIDFVCSIYVAIGAALALVLLQSVASAGMAQMHSWLLLSAAALYLIGAFIGLVFRQPSGENHKAFKRSLVSAPVVSIMLTLGLGMFTFLDPGSTVNNRTNHLTEVINEYFPLLTEILIGVISLTPLFFTFTSSNDDFLPGVIGQREFIGFTQREKQPDLIEMLVEFLRRPGNHVLFIGPERSGKSWTISKLVKENSVSDKLLGFGQDITINLDNAKINMLNVEGPFAFDEAQVLSQAGVLLPALTLANSLNKSYIVAAQTISELLQLEQEAVFHANAVKIIYFEPTAIREFGDIKWREVSRYQSQTLSNGVLPNVA